MTDRKQTLQVAISGPPFWARNLAGQLETRCVKTFRYNGRGIKGRWAQLHFALWLVSQCLHRRIIHIMGPSKGAKTAFLAKLFSVPVVYHWIGTDVHHLVHTPPGRRDVCVRRLNRWVDLQIATGTDLQKELESVGLRIDALVTNISEATCVQIIPLPETPAVLSYWRDEYADFYHADWVLELARRMPETPFRIAGSTGKDITAPPNVEFLGWLSDMDEVYRQSNVYLRLVRHDGRCGGTVPEALARGRYVIYSQKHPHCIQATNVEEAFEALQLVLAKKESNIPGATWVQEAFNADVEVNRLVQLYRSRL